MSEHRAERGQGTEAAAPRRRARALAGAVTLIAFGLAVTACEQGLLGRAPRAGDGATDGPITDGGAPAEGGAPVDSYFFPDINLACIACHGSEASEAPPLSVAGTSATSERGVGAHQQHLGPSDWRAQVLCTDCHVVPAAISDVGHIDTPLPAELTFSSRASARGAAPAWDGLRCSGVYCHGATLSGGTTTAPEWTRVDGTQAACGTCHGLPPSANGHTTATSCVACHAAVVDANMKIIAPQLHIDGQVQATSGDHPAGWEGGGVHGAAFIGNTASCGTAGCHGDDLNGGAAPSCNSCHSGWRTDCTFCHGGTDNQTGAPPATVSGQNATSAAGVGAHTTHLTAGAMSVAFDCTVCHVKHTDALDPGHIDPSPAELTFTGIATGTSYDSQAKVCGNGYCHGSTLSGGTLTTPEWTRVDGTQGACGACHGLPPTANGHTSSTDCVTCHAAVVDANMKIIAPQLHVDGKVQSSGGHPTGWGAGSVHGPAFFADTASCGTASCHGADLNGGAAPSCNSCHSGWRTDCTFCHGGTDNQTGAPPATVSGQTATSVPGVGRHTAHVTASASHAAYDCSLCHVKHADALSPGHIDPGPAEVTFTGDAAGTSYDFQTNLCSNVYCHSNGRSGNTGGAPWVGSLSGCNPCHDDETGGPAQSLSGRHNLHIGRGYSCATCHGCVVDAQKNVIDPSRHIDGARDVCGTQITSWNASTRQCSPTCHGTEDW